jgi:hypothetical protein
MANDQKHNGWHNYETWNVVVWFDNDEKLQDMKKKHLQFMRDRNAKTSRYGKGFAGKSLAIKLREFLRRRGFDGKTPDLTKKQMRKVYWSEIAERWTDEI